MLVSFEVLQIHGTAQPRLLAQGVGEALLTTEAGLWTALPILFFHHITSHQVQRLRKKIEALSRTESVADPHADRCTGTESQSGRRPAVIECEIAGG
jgi:biopolymer transport protein ExbB/TolQ